MIKIEIPEMDRYLPFLRKNIHRLPEERAGLYWLYDKNNKLLYIGQSMDIRKRIQQHLSGYRGDHYDSAVCYYVDSPLDRELYETYMINTMQPPFNVSKVFTYKVERNKSKQPKPTEEEIMLHLADFKL